MSKGIYNAVASMAAAGRRVDVIADNLANLSSTGFKRRSSAVGSFNAQLRGGETPMLATHTAYDFEQGVLVRTGETYHAALFGQGFFAIEGERGEVYTRKGNFHVGEDGVLKTEEELPVAWERRGAAIDPGGAPVVFGRDGTVLQGRAEIGRLRIVDFRDRQALRMDERGYFQAAQGAREIPFEAEVHQGELESSNASAVGELVQLIEAQRSYEMSANVLSQYDQSYKRLTRPS